ncbi:MAG: hypothetical protein ACRCX2_22940 [Paraclostridium sp.]
METPNNTVLDIIQTQIDRPELNFWKYETKMIIVAGISFIVSSGCIAILIIDRSNCALNNGIFSILGGIVGLLTGMISSKSSACTSSRRNSSI